MLNKRLIWSLLSLFIVASLLSACGPTPTPTAAPAATATTAAVAPTQPATKPPATPTPVPPTEVPIATPEAKKVVRLVITGDPVMNPILSSDPNSAWVNHFMFPSLVRIDPDTLEPEPDLATSWEVSGDGLIWTFHLREDVTWHDGTPFTADDVKFTLDSIMDEKVNTTLRSQFSALDHVEVVDAHTVNFVLTRPYSPLATQLTENVGMAPKHLLEGQDINTYATFNVEHPVGTGPFMFKEFVSGDHLTLEANSDYYGGKPAIDTVVFKIVPDANVQAAQLRTGELDFAAIEPAVLPALEGADNLRIEYVERVEYYPIILNNKRSPFDDKNVRLAMTYALDREALANAVLGYETHYPLGIIPPAIEWAFAKDLEPIPYDPDKAVELLADAGWTDSDGDGILDKDGQPFKFMITIDKGNPTREQSAAIVQQYYKTIGLDVEIEAMEFGTFIEKRYLPRDYDAILTFWTNPSDPDRSANFACDGRGNVWQYCNQEVDELLSAGVATADLEERKEIYHRFQEITTFEDPPQVILFYPKEIHVANVNLIGVAKAGVSVVYQHAEKWDLNQ
jgi:peptide/nickel transport system substrate-binding protein